VQIQGELAVVESKATMRADPSSAGRISRLPASLHGTSYASSSLHLYVLESSGLHIIRDRPPLVVWCGCRPSGRRDG
jgi:hypothetical protein